MICRKCGYEIHGQAAFCPRCGSAIEEQRDDAKPSKKRGSKKIVAGVVAVVVVALLAVGGGVWWKLDQDAKAAAAAQAAWEHAHTSVVTPVDAQVPGFDESSTSIPVQVKGTDLDGNAVDELQFLHPGSLAVVTLAGSYDLTFVGGYFTGDGKVMRAPGETVHIEPVVPGDGDEGSGGDAGSEGPSSGSASSGAAPSESAGDAGTVPGADAGPAPETTVVYTEVPALEVTDELVDEVRRWASQDEDDAGKSDQLGQLVLSNRDAAVRAEEERIAAEAEAARVAERKAAIEQTARRYIDLTYDNADSSLENSKHTGVSMTSLYSPRANRANGWGWLQSSLISIDSFEVVDEDTVRFSVTYKYGVPESSIIESGKAVTLTFDEDALILTGAVGLL